MQLRHFALALALLGPGAGGACAMNSPGGPDVSCTIEGGSLLHSRSGGAEGLCKDIEQSLAARMTAPTRVSVTVLSPFALAASIRVGARQLPEIRMAQSDRELDQAALRRFAESLAAAAEAALEP